MNGTTDAISRHRVLQTTASAASARVCEVRQDYQVIAWSATVHIACC